MLALPTDNTIAKKAAFYGECLGLKIVEANKNNKEKVAKVMIESTAGAR